MDEPYDRRMRGEENREAETPARPEDTRMGTRVFWPDSEEIRVNEGCKGERDILCYVCS